MAHGSLVCLIAQLNPAEGNKCKFSDAELELIQWQFHSPREHAFDGGRKAMEAHLVHRDTATGVLGIAGSFLTACCMLQQRLWSSCMSRAACSSVALARCNGVQNPSRSTLSARSMHVGQASTCISPRFMASAHAGHHVASSKTCSSGVNTYCVFTLHAQQPCTINSIATLVAPFRQGKCPVMPRD